MTNEQGLERIAVELSKQVKELTERVEQLEGQRAGLVKILRTQMQANEQQVIVNDQFFDRFAKLERTITMIGADTYAPC